MCDLDEWLEKCEHFSNRIIVEQNLDVCQLCLQNLYKFRDFRHFGRDYFCDYFAQKTYICIGMNRSERVFIGIDKIAVSLEITAIRCK